MHILAHKLLTTKPAQSLAFYQNLLGMTLIATQTINGCTHYRLAYVDNPGNEDNKQAMFVGQLVLIDDPSLVAGQDFTVATQPSQTEGYWKFSIAVDDIEIMREKLINSGVKTIGNCFDVANLAYLCHLQDPNGYCIELIQKTLKTSVKVNSNQPRLNLSTLRVKNAEKSLAFYQSLGMKLIYTYRSDKRNMTLYFLIAESDVALFESIDAPTLVEKMWQFPRTILELQQLDGTTENTVFRYRVGRQTGFIGLEVNSKNTGVLVDPDGYAISIS